MTNVSTAAVVKVATALRELASALDDVALSLGPAPRELRAGAGESGLVDPGVARVARNLHGRLGEANRAFIRAFAIEFEPGEDFWLEDIAQAAKVDKKTARARLMNIGRSLKALGARDVLWETTWNPDDGATSYVWTYEGHKAVMQEFR